MSKELKDHFDAVVMLTWSDWKTEPRSNRYHYASRFARHLPVYFVQPTAAPRMWPLERTELPNVTLLHTGENYSHAQSLLIEAALARHDVRRPLIWVYNVFYNDFIARHARQMVVYHGTEDYLSDPGKAFVWGNLDPIVQGFTKTLPNVDMTISVAESIRRNFRERGGYQGPSLLVPNGCDDKFWIGQQAYDHRPQTSGRPVAFYQGAINNRLDFELLRGVVRTMPDWDFWFCGRSVDPPGWSGLLAEPNVKYLGMLPLKRVAAAARNATVAIAPFVDQPLMRISVNLKYYEYVACGLPVVSSPNDALLDRPDVFTVAAGPESFANAIRSLAPTRSDPESIKHRLAAAGEQSYDAKFDLVSSEISRRHDELTKSPGRRNVLVLSSESAANNKATMERLAALKDHLPHTVCYFPCPEKDASLASSLFHWDLAPFDVLILDSSLTVAGKDGMSAALAKVLREYDGCKIALLRDMTWQQSAQSFLEFLRVDVVVTDLPEKGLRADRDGSQRIPSVARWSGNAGDVSAIVEHVIERAASKKPTADLVTVPAPDESSEAEGLPQKLFAFARPDSKTQIVRPSDESRNGLADSSGGQEDPATVAVLPGYSGSVDLKLVWLFVIRVLIRTFFSVWDRLPDAVRAPVIAILPKRMRRAMREGGPKLFAR